MKHRASVIPGIICFFICFFLTVPLFSQYREYYVYGVVVDTNGQPIPGAEMFLRDTMTSRSYRVTTDKEGKYKLVGIPHGIYRVSISKEGFKTRTVEWNFDSPQDRMQKVEIEPIVMVSEELIEKIQWAKKAQEDFKEASEKVSQGDLDGAINILKGMIENNPEDANAHYLLGISCLKKKMFPEAVEAFTKTIELSPSFAGAYHQLGLYYQHQNEKEKALEYYEKAFELEPESVDSLYNAGLILFQLSRIDEALTRFIKALEKRPEEPEFLEMAGRCYIHQGDFTRAAEYLEKAKNAYSDEEKVKFLEQLIAKLKEMIKE